MKQALKDLMLRLQKERRFQVIAVVGIIIVVFSMMNGRVRQSGFSRLQLPAGTGSMGNEEAYNDIIQRFGADLDGVKTDVREIRRTIDEQSQSVQEFEQRTAEIFKKMLERMAEVENTRVVSGTGGPTDVSDEELAEPPGIGADDELEAFGLEQGQAQPPAPATVPRIAFIGQGDSVRVKLLAGVNAPTDGSPYPVVFKLMSDVYGPDGSALPLGEARVVAAAQGSMVDQRALFRLTSMNIRFPNGRRSVVEADGWVVGEDGIRGLKGVLIDPLGKAILGAGFAAAIEGAGEGVSASQLTTNQNAFGGGQQFISGNTGEYAAGKGIQRGAEVYSGLIIERLKDLKPVVQVYSGREATVVFAKNIEIPDLYDALQDNEEAFTELD